MHKEPVSLTLLPLPFMFTIDIVHHGYRLLNEYFCMSVSRLSFWFYLCFCFRRSITSVFFCFCAYIRVCFSLPVYNISAEMCIFICFAG